MKHRLVKRRGPHNTETMAKLEAQVEALLKEGVDSNETIAAKVGVSTTTVWIMSSGRRPMNFWRLKLIEKEEGNSRWRLKVPLRHTGPGERCVTCGGMVHLPCAVCRTRREGGPRPYKDVKTSGDLSLKLFGDELARHRDIVDAVHARGLPCGDEDAEEDDPDYYDDSDVSYEEDT